MILILLKFVLRCALSETRLKSRSLTYVHKLRLFQSRAITSLKKTISLILIKNYIALVSLLISAVTQQSLINASSSLPPITIISENRLTLSLLSDYTLRMIKLLIVTFERNLIRQILKYLLTKKTRALKTSLSLKINISPSSISIHCSFVPNGSAFTMFVALLIRQLVSSLIIEADANILLQITTAQLTKSEPNSALIISYKTASLLRPP